MRLLDAIDYLIDNVDVAREKGCNGRRAICEKYNWTSEELKLMIYTIDYRFSDEQNIRIFLF